MKLKFTSHSVERSLERTGMTGVQLNHFLMKKIKPKHFKSKVPKYFWIRGLKVLMKNNLIITVFKPIKQKV